MIYEATYGKEADLDHNPPPGFKPNKQDNPIEVVVENEPPNILERTIQTKPQQLPVPFPNRLRKEKEEAQQQKFLENLKQLHINILFIEVLVKMPKYDKYLKILLTNKSILEEACTYKFHAYAMYEELGLGEPKPARMILELADRVGDNEVIFILSMKKPPTEDDECYNIDDLDDLIDTMYSEEKKTVGADTNKNEHLYSASANEIDEKKPKLKDLPSYLDYAYLHGDECFPIIISSKLFERKKRSLLQILIAPEDQEKTAFTFPYGTFAYRRMSFGLCDAPETFQRCMTTIFHDMVEDFMEVFIDDFLVFVPASSSSTTTTDTTSGETGTKSGRTVTLTAEDIQKKKNDFMDVKIEQDDINQKFLTSLAPEWLMHTIVWRNRGYFDTIFLDDFYNHLKVYESEVQKKLKPNSQNMAFIPSVKHSSGNEDGNTACIPTASTNVPTASASVATISQDIACAHIASQSVMGHFARECKASRSQDRGRRDNYRQGSKAEEQAPKALMEIDRVGWDWSYMENNEEDHALVADEVAPTEFALMVKTSAESKVFDNSLCSKDCKKNNDSLNKLWAAILKTFGGNEATKKTKKNLLKQQYGNFKSEGSETLEQMFNRLDYSVQQSPCLTRQKILSHLRFNKWYQSLMRSFDQQKNNIQAHQKKKMMKKSSSSKNEPCCSKDCKKNTETLNKKITNLSDKLFDVNNMIYHYKLALAQVESRLVKYKEREVKYCEKIKTLEFHNESHNKCIEILKKKLETLKEEKEWVDGKQAGLLKASKDLDNLIKSQRSDKINDGL
uniref:Reverse transcriptase domain-containing protein n=1 Tax=Tanacetum cinerariifolium TaxID=118510 RepID=A0A6L2NAR3_TANCI|nr:hypothetical protein [Tanacetum cinerariifolium]